MGKKPSFQFYHDDYIGGTMGFTIEQHGAYLLCLISQFKDGHLSEEKLNQVCGGRFDLVKSKFITDGSGLYFNERMDEISLSSRLYKISRTINRDAKCQKCKNKTEIDNICISCVDHMMFMCLSYDDHMGDGDGDGDVFKNLNTEVENTNTTTIKDSSTLSRERTPLSPVAEEDEPRPIPAWVQEHKALERGENLKAEIDRLINCCPIYGTRMTVTKALGVAKARGGYDESIALACLPSRAVYERNKGMKTPMKLETLLETGGWAIDWEARLSEEQKRNTTTEEVDDAY